MWVKCGLELNFYACQCSQSNCAYNACIIKNILDRICESLVLTHFFFSRLLGWVGSTRANLRLECGLAKSINGVSSLGAVEGSSFLSLMTMLSCPISFALSSSPSLPECQHLGVQRGSSSPLRGLNKFCFCDGPPVGLACALLLKHRATILRSVFLSEKHWVSITTLNRSWLNGLEGYTGVLLGQVLRGGNSIN